MKHSIFRKFLMVTLMFGVFGVTGCKSAPKDTEENPGMTEKQKALIKDHKKKQDE